LAGLAVAVLAAGVAGVLELVLGAGVLLDEVGDAALVEVVSAFGAVDSVADSLADEPERESVR
jgi:hypothetical protein